METVESGALGKGGPVRTKLGCTVQGFAIKDVPEELVKSE